MTNGYGAVTKSTGGTRLHSGRERLSARSGARRRSGDADALVRAHLSPLAVRARSRAAPAPGWPDGRDVRREGLDRPGALPDDGARLARPGPAVGLVLPRDERA